MLKWEKIPTGHFLGLQIGYFHYFSNSTYDPNLKVFKLCYPSFPVMEWLNYTLLLEGRGWVRLRGKIGGCIKWWKKHIYLVIRDQEHVFMIKHFKNISKWSLEMSHCLTTIHMTLFGKKMGLHPYNVCLIFNLNIQSKRFN